MLDALELNIEKQTVELGFTDVIKLFQTTAWDFLTLTGEVNKGNVITNLETLEKGCWQLRKAPTCYNTKACVRCTGIKYRETDSGTGIH